MADERELLMRFERALAGVGLHDDQGLGLQVLAAYREPGRHYHNQEHLLAVLARLETLRPAARAAAARAGSLLDESAVILAAFFHDFVYVTDGGAESESDSARVARARLLAAGTPAALAGEVARLVLVTAEHQYQDQDVAAGWLCDADLDVLSWSRPRYAAYVAAVRAEYAHAPEAAWRSGRAQVLAALLTRPRLYLLAGSKAERKARVNLAGELATLR